MGHFHSQNLDTLLLEHIFEKGSASVDDLVKEAKEKKQYVHASEGIYKEKYMIVMSFETLFSLHYEYGHIRPILDTEKKTKAFQAWRKDELLDSFGTKGQSIGLLKVLDGIQFEFTSPRKNKNVLHKITFSEIES